jgi:hypothetical protein
VPGLISANAEKSHILFRHSLCKMQNLVRAPLEDGLSCVGIMYVHIYLLENLVFKIKKQGTVTCQE